VGIGWCASQHISAFHKNPHTDIVALVGRDVDRVHATLAKNGQSAGNARVSTRFEDLLEAPDVHIIDIATPNDLHAAQAVAAAKAGKHILLEKPTGLNVQELIAIRDAVRAAGVRTIVSFELRYNPWLKFIRWMRESGRLGRIHYARTNYLSRVTDWYSGWEWCRTVKGGGSHLLAAGCHAVDALRWATGLEIAEVSAYHIKVTPGYEWPTTIDVNVRFEGGAIGHVTSTTDFQMPYAFGVEVMGDFASIRDVHIKDIDIRRPLAPIASIKVKLGFVIAVAVAVTVFVFWVGIKIGVWPSVSGVIAAPRPRSRSARNCVAISPATTSSRSGEEGSKCDAYRAS